MRQLWTPPIGRRQNKNSFTNESRLERWYGAEMFRMLQETSEGLGCLVPVLFPPSGDGVYAGRGVFVGAIRGGGFASLSDLISEATTGGKRQDFLFTKAGTTGVVGFSNSLWRVGNLPSSGAAATALAAGDHLNNLSLGAPGLADPTGGDTLHLTTFLSQATLSPNLLMMYDRLWEGLIALSSSATQTCTLTGYPNSTGRYSGIAGGSAGSGGNFAFVANEAGATLSAVAHTWTMVYTDNGGNVAQSAAAIAGISGAITNRIDHASWFIPLLNSDYGISDIESIACDVATLAAGSPTIVLAHPLALVPQLVNSAAVVLDGINSAFSLVEFKTDCCPAFMEVNRTGTGVVTYTGQATLVSG